jgi:type IX secretion system PorP/SprF family membrane protein
VTADLPLSFWSPNHAAGAGFMNDAIGLFSHKKIYVQYALHIPLGWQKKSRISIGARLVILSEKFDGSGVDTDESNDKAFPTSEVSGFAIDAEIGARYTWSDVWYVGASAMHLTGPTIELGDDKVNEMKISPTFYLTGGYKLKFRDKRYSLDTHGILRSDFQAIRGDIVARLGYEGLKNKLYGGVLYSPTNSVGFLFGMNFHGVEIGYSYEMYTGGVGLQNGTHEIVLGYQMDMKKSKKGKNMHKSVRFL